MPYACAPRAVFWAFACAASAASGVCWAAGVDFPTQVQPIFSSYSCTGCHGSGGDAGMDLRTGQSYANLVNVVSTTNPPELRVKPFDAANSLLPQKISATHHGKNVSAADKTTIANWINEGALASAGGGGNQPPVIAARASATPNPAQANQTVTFTVTATDADGDALTYSWNFGDSTTGTGATATHAYAADGTYAVSVTVSDGKGGTVASNVSVTVGSNSPGGSLTIQKLSAKIRFGTGIDRVTVSGTIANPPPGITPAGAVVTVDIGGATAQFALDAKGAVKTPAGDRFKMKAKGATAQFKTRLQGSTLSFAWFDEGVDPALTTKGQPIVLGVEIGVDGTTHSVDFSGMLRSKAQKTASIR